ncbi:hypothetical protein JCM33374_g3607 [Metschnikowia sp. JCM 33374]|nr:hypothetical protein JCM33374_g3607 [Metschnikowia sp. JCM 33374]
MSLTSDTLSARISALELQVGIGKQWRQHEMAERSADKSLVHEIANLQAKVDRIFVEDPDLRNLPEIIKQYRKDPIPRKSLNFEPAEGVNFGENTCEAGDHGANSSKADTAGNTVVLQDISSTEKQESISIKYPDILECYNLLVEFSQMEIPTLSSALSDQLKLEPLMVERAQCETIAKSFHLLVVKNLMLLEEFSDMIKYQTAFSQNVDKRMRVLSSKLASLERKRQLETKY